MADGAVGAALISSVLARTEVLRAVGRTDSAAVPTACQLLDAVSVVEMDAELADEAAEIELQTLRSLDALHLASALRISTAIGALITYDERMLTAAQARGLSVERPGRSA